MCPLGHCCCACSPGQLEQTVAATEEFVAEPASTMGARDAGCRWIGTMHAHELRLQWSVLSLQVNGVVRHARGDGAKADRIVIHLLGFETLWRELA